MRIRKVSQSTPIKAKVVNSHSESEEETYSCAYLNGTTLYENTNGSNTNITLSDSLANYKAIKVIYSTDNNNRFAMKEVLEPNGKTLGFTITFSDSTSGFYIRSRTIELNGTRMSTTGNRYSNISVNTSSVVTLISSNDIYIHKVIGYK